MHRDFKPENVMVTRDGRVKSRFRARAGRRRRAGARGRRHGHRQRHHRRHRPVHEPRAGARRNGRLPDRSVFAGPDAVRDADRPTGVQARNAAADARRHSRGRARADRETEPARAGAAAMDDRAVPGERPAAALRRHAPISRASCARCAIGCGEFAPAETASRRRQRGARRRACARRSRGGAGGDRTGRGGASRAGVR